MATDIIKGAFPEFAGLLSTPRESLLAAPIQAARASTQTPMQALTGEIQGASAQLQQSVGGLFGQVPAQVAQQDKLRSIVTTVQNSGVDLATPEGLEALAAEFNKSPEFAGIGMSLRQQAMKMREDKQMTGLKIRKIESEIEENVAQAEKARKPDAAQSPFAKINPADFKPHTIKKFMESGGDWSKLEARDKPSDGDKFGPAERWNSEIDAAQNFLRLNNVDITKPLPTSKAALPGYSDAYEKANRPRWGGGNRPFAGTAPKATAIPLPQNPSPTNLTVYSEQNPVIYQTARGPAKWDGSKFISVGQ